VVLTLPKLCPFGRGGFSALYLLSCVAQVAFADDVVAFEDVAGFVILLKMT
jgi:hypothetical protein